MRVGLAAEWRDERRLEVLRAIVATEVSPELVPVDAPAGVSMSAAFPIDLSRHSAADLFAVAGAALPGD